MFSLTTTRTLVRSVLPHLCSRSVNPAVQVTVLRHNSQFYTRKLELDAAAAARAAADSETRFQDGSPILDRPSDHGYKLAIDGGKLYEDHVQLSYLQRAVLSAGAGLMALYDPYRDDMVATFGETTGYYALEKMYNKMAHSPEGVQILQDRPRINSTTVDIERLGKLAPNTFGYAYYRFLTDNKVSPDTRKVVRFVDDPELAYVMQRYREVHDLVHTILGMPTNMLGEVLVKWVEAIQTDLPMCWLGGLFGPVRLKTRKARDLYTKHLQWALKCGHEAQDLLCVYYEHRFEEDLDQLRAELRIPTPPKID